jgi:phosphoribosylamine--glycine ligase
VKVLIVGSGGREHALAWKIAQSPLVEQLLCAPGNPGMAALGRCVDIGVNDFEKLGALARDAGVGLAVVGPEDPLSRGLVDYFTANGIKAFGPVAAAARLEASKSFAKNVMSRCGIPTAQSEEFTCPDAAINYVRDTGAPVVIKADGLAAGKGVTVARDLDTAVSAIRSAMEDRAFGDAGNRVLVEEYLEGEEASILAFSDGKTVIPMASSQDHKPAFDNDEGPNTGGMGAYSPAPVVTDALHQEIVDTILNPCAQTMAEAGTPYTGVLYAGLMITPDGPKVIEFNCRFGDPEVQVVLPRMKNDLVPVLLACCDGTLEQISLDWEEGACVTVVMASGGYPGAYQKGKTISGIAEAERETGAVVFHAGTAQKGPALVTNGGRVLNVTATGPDVPTAIERAYAGVRRIHFENAHYRTDIGKKALKRLGG